MERVFDVNGLVDWMGRGMAEGWAGRLGTACEVGICLDLTAFFVVDMAGSCNEDGRKGEVVGMKIDLYFDARVMDIKKT